MAILIYNKMIRTLLLVGTGGFIGSVMRYLVQITVEKGLTSTFPLGTMIANITGSFIIGIVFALAEKGNLMNAEWRMFLAVGFCGGFTTFSSFAYNNFTMLKTGTFGQFFWNVGGSLFLGILAVYLGVILVRAVF
ncbi:fluoride efflux transporter CrcB [Maribellus comscasis]|nr:fluoride efflux transporter CrcB [Maribellus comscasis]